MLSGMAPHSSGMFGLAHRGFHMNDYHKHLSHFLHDHGYYTVLSGVQHEAKDDSVLGYDELQTGLAFLPTTIAMGTLSIRYSERLVTRYGARNTMVPGIVAIGAALLLLARVPVAGDYWVDVLPSMVLLGIGAGLAFPALMNLAMSGAAPEEAGLASGLVNTTAQIGGAVGLAVLATLSATRTERLAEQGEGELAALTGGYHLAFLIGALLAAAALVVALTVLKPGTPAEAGAGVEEETVPGEPDALGAAPAAQQFALGAEA